MTRRRKNTKSNKSQKEKKEPRPIFILKSDDVAALMDAAQHPELPRTLNAVRNRALVAVLYKSGLRVSEALALTPNDVTERDGVTWLNVRCGKGGKQRTSRLFNGAAKELELWLDMRASRVSDDAAPIFCTTAAQKAGKPLSRIYVANMLKRLATQANITKRVHAHGFRHTHATELFHRGTSVAVIQAQLGHSDVATTFNYLASLSCSDAHEQLAAIDW